jgi:hypothetical protein
MSDEPLPPPPDVLAYGEFTLDTARHGILLLVHQKPRPKGWDTSDGRHIQFPEVVDI